MCHPCSTGYNTTCIDISVLETLLAVVAHTQLAPKKQAEASNGQHLTWTLERDPGIAKPKTERQSPRSLVRAKRGGDWDAPRADCVRKSTCMHAVFPLNRSGLASYREKQRRRLEAWNWGT